MITSSVAVGAPIPAVLSEVIQKKLVGLVLSGDESMNDVLELVPIIFV